MYRSASSPPITQDKTNECTHPNIPHGRIATVLTPSSPFAFNTVSSARPFVYPYTSNLSSVRYVNSSSVAPDTVCPAQTHPVLEVKTRDVTVLALRHAERMDLVPSMLTR